MNAVEIEQALSDLAAQAFDGAEFPFHFLAAFGNKSTTIARLRKGESNASDVPGGVLQRNHIHIAVAEPGGGQPDTRVPETVASHDPFAASALAPSRPWPRAVLPGLASGALTVDYETAGTSSGYDYFEPQLPVDEAPVD